MISLILPYWERQEATEKALRLIGDRYADLLDLEVVIVDDGSPTPFKAPLWFPLPLRVVRLPAKAEAKNPCVPINRGVEAAVGDIIVLSNPEVLHKMAVLPAMLEELERLGPDGYVLTAAWCPEEKAWHCHSSIAGDRPSGEKQPAGSGFHFCAMLNRSLWGKAGGFDEAYRDGAGYEDPDWVNRVARAGAKFVIRDDLIVTHPKTGARTKWPEGGYDRNRALFMQKWQAASDLQLRVVCVKWGGYWRRKSSLRRTPIRDSGLRSPQLYAETSAPLGHHESFAIDGNESGPPARARLKSEKFNSIGAPDNQVGLNEPNEFKCPSISEAPSPDVLVSPGPVLSQQMAPTLETDTSAELTLHREENIAASHGDAAPRNGAALGPVTFDAEPSLAIKETGSILNGDHSDSPYEFREVVSYSRPPQDEIDEWEFLPSPYGPEYVNRLYAMVARNLANGTPGQFICYTDNPEGINPAVTVRDLPADLNGWWGKLTLFRDGEFTEGERVIFFDLDTVIVGPIDTLRHYDGQFAMLRDCYRPDNLGSGVMIWRGGFGSDIWDEWVKAGCPRIEGGDQAWIERIHPEADRLQDAFPGRFASFKVDCNPFPPEGASVVYFHGWPKPHETDRRWVAEIWQEGDGGGFSLALERNTTLEMVRAQSEASAKRGIPHIRSKPAHDGHVAIVGGAPSAALFIEEIRWRKSIGQQIWALNGVHDWLIDHGLEPDTLVMLDARRENVSFVKRPHAKTRYYVASQCHPEVYDALNGFDVVRVDLDKLGNCGTTVGTHALALAFIEGFREMHLYGVDSSYSGDEGHAYAQELNAGEKKLAVTAGERTFVAAPWMVQQAMDLQSLSRDLTAHGCTITVHGYGLWPEFARLMNNPDGLPRRTW